MKRYIKVAYELFLRHYWPLITYRGEVYFTNKGLEKHLQLDRYASSEWQKFINNHAIVDKEEERDRYKHAITLRVSGEAKDLKDR